MEQFKWVHIKITTTNETRMKTNNSYQVRIQLFIYSHRTKEKKKKIWKIGD